MKKWTNIKKAWLMGAVAIICAVVSNQAVGQVVLYADDFTSTNTIHDDGGFNYYTTPTGVATQYTRLTSIDSDGLQQIDSDTLKFIEVNSSSGDGLLFADLAAGTIPDANTRYNWASNGTTIASTITSEGGLRIEFDMKWSNPGDNNGYVQFCFGTTNGPVDPGNDKKYDSLDVDLGLRLEGDRVDIKDNGDSVATVNYPSAVAANTFVPVVIQLNFDSFDAGTDVDYSITVDGDLITTNVMQLDTTDDFRWEMDKYYYAGSDIWMDNFEVSAYSEAAAVTPISIALSGNQKFKSGDTNGTVIGTLSATQVGSPVAATYSFVSGTGDTDNNKFDIADGTNFVVNADFSGGASTNGQEYSVRIQGIGGGTTNQEVFVLTVIKDDDLDGILDFWTLQYSDDFSSFTPGDWTTNNLFLSAGTAGYPDYASIDGELRASCLDYSGSGAIRTALLLQNDTLETNEVVYLDVNTTNYVTGGSTEPRIGVVISLEADPTESVSAPTNNVWTYSNVLYVAVRPDSTRKVCSQEFKEDGTDGPFLQPDVNLAEVKGVYIERKAADTFEAGWVSFSGERHAVNTIVNSNFVGNSAYFGVWSDVRNAAYSFGVDNLRVYNVLGEGGSVITFDPVITSISVSGSDVTLTWTADSVGTYTIQRKTDLTAGSWSDVLGSLAAGGGTETVTASGADQEFYQIKGE